MKILIVSQYFWPESFRINDLALDLLRRGHEVSVLTGKPNYPQGKFYDGYGFFTHRHDNYEGIKVYRVPLIPRGRGSGFQLAVNYLTFVFFSCLFIFFNRKKYEVTLTFGISPITQVYAALMHKWLRKSKAYLWVQDLWPETVSAAGKINISLVHRILTRMVKYIYRKVDKVLISSEAFAGSIIEKGVSPGKIAYLPNWAEDLFSENNSVSTEKYREIIPRGFVVMFAGNLGEAQDFESIIKAAEQTKHIKEIKWVIVGDGRKKAWVENEIKKLDLKDTFILIGRYPTEEMPDFFVHADITLVTLKSTGTFDLTLPAKIQSYMAFGKPVFSMLNGIGKQVITEASCGYCADSGDYEQLADNVIKAFHLSEIELREMGLKGKEYYSVHFSKMAIIDNLERLLRADNGKNN